MKRKGINLKRDIITILSFIVLGALLVLLSWLNVTHLSENIHTDIILEMDYGRLVCENKSIFPVNWYAGSEHSFFRPAILYALFYKMTGNYTLSQSLSLIVTLAILVFVVALLSYSFMKKNRKYFLFAPILLLSMSGTYRSFSALTFLYYGYYGFYFIAIIFTIWFFANKENVCNKVIKIVSWGIIILSAFLLGFTSIRMTIYLYLPLFLAVILKVILENYHQYNVKDKWRVLIGKNNFYALGILLINLTGFLLGKKLAERLNITIDVTNTAWIDFVKLRDNIWATIVAFQKMLLGTSDSQPLFSTYTVDVLLKLVLIVFLIYCLIKKNKNIIKNFEFITLVCSIFIVTIIMTFTTYGSGAASYFFLLPIVVGWMAVYVIENEKGIKQAVIIGLIFLIFVSNAVTYYIPYLKGTVNEEPGKVAEFLIDNGYDVVFSTFWEAAPLEFQSNGRLRVAYLDMNNEGILQEHKSSCQKDLFDKKEEKSVIVFNELEEGILLENRESILYTHNNKKLLDLGYLNVYLFPDGVSFK